MTITALEAYKRVLKMQPGKIKIKEIRNYEAKNDINGNLHLKQAKQAPLQADTFGTPTLYVLWL